MKRSNEWRRTVIAGLLAAAIMSCGPAGMEMMGDAMVDAGNMLMDAGMEMMEDAGMDMEDAAEAMMDAGDAMADTGEAVMDAADGMMDDAEAQPGCATSCTGGGVQRTVSVETDPDQHISGNLPQFATLDVLADPMNPSGTRAFLELESGPLFLTDASLPLAAAEIGVRGTVVFYASDATDGCSVEASVAGRRERTLGRTLFELGGVFDSASEPAAATTHRQGARYLVSDSEILCAEVRASGSGSQRLILANSLPNRVSWSAFRPYE